MALSNWLTRDEWNAVFFMGIAGAMTTRDPVTDLGDQMRLGIKALHKADYKFEGIDSEVDGGYTKVKQVCEGNETVLAELMGAYGGFDLTGRADEAVQFIDKEIPGIDDSLMVEVMNYIDSISNEGEQDGD